MGKARKGGRPKQRGERYPSGKLRPRIDKGCEGVQRRRTVHAWTDPDNKHRREEDHTFDAIGRAWSAGLLIHDGKDPVAIRDAGRELGALYWRFYGVGAYKDTLERFVEGRGGEVNEDALEHALTKRLEAIPRHTRPAINSLCLNFHFDDGPAWLDRLIADLRWDGRMSSIRDRETMELALEGLAVLV